MRNEKAERINGERGADERLAVSGTPRQAGTVKLVPFRGFQRQRKLTTRGLVILRILRILCETRKINQCECGNFLTQNPQNSQNINK